VVDVANAVDGHVVLRDEGGDFQLIHVDDAVQVFDSRDRVDLLFDGRCHECKKPPSHYLSPKGWMDDIERFEVLLVLVLEDVIDLAHPLH